MAEPAICGCGGGEAPEPPEEAPEGGYKSKNPPVRYDTTGALTFAARGRRPVPLGPLIENADPSAPNPAVRYNTTGALSSCYTGDFPPKPPPVSVGSPGGGGAAAGGAGDLETSSSCSCCLDAGDSEPPEPPEERPADGYKMKNPPVRYDTTGALTFAARGRRPVPLGELVDNPDPSAPNPPARYNTTGALSSCAIPGKPPQLTTSAPAAAACACTSK